MDNPAVAFETEDGLLIVNGQFNYGTFTAWYADGCYHREDGPAVIRRGDVQGAWYVRGRAIKSYAQLQTMTDCTDSDILMFKLKYGEME